MHPLPSSDVALILPLVQVAEIRSHLALAHAVIEGRQEGAVFVDDPACPRTALLCPRNGFFFPFGDPESGALDRFMPSLLAHHLVDKPLLLATSAAWQRKLDSLFDVRGSRAGYDLPDRRVRMPHWRDQVPPGLTMERMTAAVIARWSAGIDPWVIEIWGGADTFVARCFGFCLLADDHIVSFATACGIGGGEAEVEVGTVPEYRNRGLATLACSAFLEECLARGLTPAWSCEAGNAPSAALARRLGFRNLEEVPVYPLAAKV
jgi:RimJ/RimL family protein N-acetyltransferase